MASEKKVHFPLPKTTKAFFCANCGAVSLSPKGICKLQGHGTKADWCGTETIHPAKFCKNKVHNIRYKCENCGQVAVNPELLCRPEKMPVP